jgi:hypothetical protein
MKRNACAGADNGPPGQDSEKGIMDWNLKSNHFHGYWGYAHAVKAIGTAAQSNSNIYKKGAL